VSIIAAEPRCAFELCSKAIAAGAECFWFDHEQPQVGIKAAPQDLYCSTACMSAAIEQLQADSFTVDELLSMGQSKLVASLEGEDPAADESIYVRGTKQQECREHCPSCAEGCYDLAVLSVLFELRIIFGGLVAGVGDR
jgi:hypothetical protein